MTQDAMKPSATAVEALGERLRLNGGDLYGANLTTALAAAYAVDRVIPWSTYQARQTELLKSNNEQLERARAAETERDQKQARIAALEEALEDCESTLDAFRDIPPNEATRMIVDRSLEMTRAVLANREA
jgi:hypothetical protein